MPLKLYYLSIILPHGEIIRFEPTRQLHSELYTPLEEVADVVSAVEDG